tara:strand:+ start:2715 stop:3020 length:306 start_codon:yes stop_codon:yes gene_type:complete
MKTGDKRTLLKKKGLTEIQIEAILQDTIKHVALPKDLDKRSKTAKDYGYVQQSLLVPIDVYLVLKEVAKLKGESVQDIIIDIIKFETEYSIIESFKAYEGL